ncbi:hypothetical protein NESM_000264900 [Novymonas esmeraldas]|uniref:Uncharacterized protein n=1 Tax=Novymonas esmeraldas TaxID=1808958 RepID=A0AAW0F7F9_9TRYP
MSHYTVSSSESSSFCTNPISHSRAKTHADCAESVVVSVSKPTRARPSTGAASEGGGESDAAGSARVEPRTPTKAAQLSKTATAAAAQESPSMTIRRVPVDYSKRMEDQKARSNALERYKMLVRGSRLVESAESSPKPVAPQAASESPVHRGVAQRRPVADHRGGSTVSDTVVSDDSGAAEEEEAMTPMQRDAAATGPRSSSRRLPRQPTQFSSSPVPAALSVDRQSATPAEEEAAVGGDIAGDSPAPVVPQLALANPCSPQSPSRPAPACAADVEVEAEAGVQYVAPELTQPYGTSSLRRRGTVRPGYEPVTAHEAPPPPQQQRTASASRAHAVDATPSTSPTPKAQPRSHTRRAVGAGTHPVTAAAAPPSSHQSTPRRGTVAAAVASVAAADEEERPVEAPPARDVSTQLFCDDEGADAPLPQGPQAAVMPLAGTTTAFWLRPSTAMYAMTASIAAKRKDHHEDEEDTHRSRHHRTHSQTRRCASSAGTPSNCGTPRGRPSTAAEGKPRFSTCMTGADRARYEEVPPAVTATAAAAPQTYDSIYSARRSTMHASGVSHGSRRAPADVSSVQRSRDSPRRRSQQQQQQQQPLQRLDSLRSPAERRPSTLSRLSSNPPISAASEEPHRAADAGRVSTRQQDSFSKHCARVAARATRPAEPSHAAAVPATRATPGKVATAPPAQRTSAAAYTLSPSETEAEAEPVPRTTVPRSTTRDGGATPVEREPEPEPQPTSPETTIHGRRRTGEGSPSKSRRREHDLTASPARPDDRADVEAQLAAQDEAMAREKEEARVQLARAALESCRQARQARAAASRTSQAAFGTAASTNEVVAAILQGVVQQTRQSLPCYLCADQQSSSAYRVHVSSCRPTTEALLLEYHASTAGADDASPALLERIRGMAAYDVPAIAADETARAAFVKECYQCVKALLVPCRKCGVHVRVHDVKEHELLCGRAYYRNSRAAERVRATVERIEHGSHE